MRVEEMTINSSGGKQHKVAHRCEADFPRAQLEVARLRAEGYERHGYEDDNYLHITAFEHIGRAKRHLYLYQIGDTEDGTAEEHLVHAACRILMALEEVLIEKETARKNKVSRELEYLQMEYGYND